MTTTTEYTPEQLQEINAFEDKHGFPGVIEVGNDAERLDELTPSQRRYARDWLRIASARFGAELQGQLGRWPTVSELASRLKLSVDMHAHRPTQH